MTTPLTPEDLELADDLEARNCSFDLSDLVASLRAATSHEEVVALVQLRLELLDLERGFWVDAP